MVLDTRYLFCRLLRLLEIGTVCDVGSMDGGDAMCFRKWLPSASVLAFEANPRNCALMRDDDRLRSLEIEVLPLAPSDRASSAARFYIVAADYAPGRDRFRRGISSLLRRSGGVGPVEVARVETVRLDQYLASRSLDDTSIALWIDTEGTAFDVLTGCQGVLDRVRLVHVEVENEPFIADRQKLFADVERLMADSGFLRLATDQPDHVLQFNALYIRADALAPDRPDVLRHMRRARLRRRLRRAAARLLPTRLGLRWGFVLSETRCR